MDKRIPFELGKVEGGEKVLVKNCRVGSSLAVFASGGDSSGMNSAVRAVVRTGLYMGCRTYVVKEGYKGLVKGADMIVEQQWASVSDIIQLGGSEIGSARCEEFRKREGMLKACRNLVELGITNLVCIGGDGSLTGANEFRAKWPSLLKELVETNAVPKERLDDCSNVNIVGLVGSIDNDFCGTDMTIGVDSALHRITEAIDNLMTTAKSHQRTIVVEVMGRHCGYLALAAAMANAADWLFVPESPPAEGWQADLCAKLNRMRNSYGQRHNIVVISEGAINQKGNKIRAEEVRTIIKNGCGYDTRVTILGHVQRGGDPSAFDRLLGCRMGVEAVVALMEMQKETEPIVVGIRGNLIVRLPLKQAVEATRNVQKFMDAKQFQEAVDLRGGSFKGNLNAYRFLSNVKAPVATEERKFNVAVMHVGAPAAGMNSATRAFVRCASHHNCDVYAIHNGFEGLLAGDVKKFGWKDVTGWTMEMGSKLGTRPQIPLEDVGKKLKELKIQGLAIIGDFDAFESCRMMTELRNVQPEYQIPMVVVPASVSNGVPGTDFCLGSDTLLNRICSSIDAIKISSAGSGSRAFIVGTPWGANGYLPILGALASGADDCYTCQEQIGRKDFLEDFGRISAKIQSGADCCVVVKGEKTGDGGLTAQVLAGQFNAKAKGKFSCHAELLEYWQQGRRPSPFDRIQGVKLGLKAAEFLVEKLNGNHWGEAESAVTLGLVGGHLCSTPMKELSEQADKTNRIQKGPQWWLKLRPLGKMLAGQENIYN